MKYQTHVTGPFALTQLAAAAAALALAVISTSAYSLGLGRLSVQSALGETLKAEIDITSLSAEEAGTLKVRIAPPESYRATGVEYNSVLTGAQVQVTRRDGRTLLRVSSDRAVQEPFVDVILELTWASGRLVREYTLLFDPPSAVRPAAAPPVVAAAPVLMAPAPAATEPVNTAPPAVSTALPARPAPAAASSRPAVPRPAPEPTTLRQATQYAVKPGDTLSRIASKTQVPGISLDQMLVGLYRSNPDAFIDRNMNLLKAGSLLQVPASNALAEVTQREARQVIQAQSADFSAYRQRLAGVAPTLRQEESERQSKGRVQAAIDDRKPAAAATPDRLTLSKAASAVAEAKLSEEAKKKDAAARVAELTRNVEALKQLSGAAKPAPVVAAAAPAPAPAPAAVATATAASQPISAAPVPTVAVAAPRPAMVAASAAAIPPLPPAQPSQRAEPGLLDQLTENPLLPLGALLLLAAGAFGFYRLRNRQGENKSDTGFIESRLQPDSFFGNSGGSRVDTRDAGTGASSMTYSLSQLDAIGDVDPVAEADVYLAYGRDLQAEEILKEALRATPERLAIRLKLLEVYAKRRDTKGFEQLAIQLYAETHGAGDDWAKAQEMGRQVDAENPLYHPGGAPAKTDTGRDIHPEPMDASTLPHTVNANSPQLAVDAFSRSGPDTGPMSGFDLDLDLDLPAPSTGASMAATQAMPASAERAPLEMDFDLSRPRSSEVNTPDLPFDLNAPKKDDAVTPTRPGSDNALDFDLSNIDLSLPSESTGTVPEPIPFAEHAATQSAADTAADKLAHALEELGDDDGDPLMRQLELADEFRQIGDTEGAREVLQELLAKATGPLHDKAQAMLNELR